MSSEHTCAFKNIVGFRCPIKVLFDDSDFCYKHKCTKCDEMVIHHKHYCEEHYVEYKINKVKEAVERKKKDEEDSMCEFGLRCPEYTCFETHLEGSKYCEKHNKCCSRICGEETGRFCYEDMCPCDEPYTVTHPYRMCQFHFKVYLCDNDLKK